MRCFDVLCVSVRRVGNLCQRRQVIHPVERWLAGNGVYAAHQEVHVVGVARPQARRQLPSDKVCQARWGQLGLVAERV